VAPTTTWTPGAVIADRFSIRRGLSSRLRRIETHLRRGLSSRLRRIETHLRRGLSSRLRRIETHLRRIETHLRRGLSSRLRRIETHLRRGLSSRLRRIETQGTNVARSASLGACRLTARLICISSWAKRSMPGTSPTVLTVILRAPRLMPAGSVSVCSACHRLA
jgi:exonuclease VII large subunit